MPLTFKDSFSKHLNSFSTAPYLFIGSGLSRRFLGVPTWLDLFKNILSTLGLPKPYEYYLSNSESNLPLMATLISEDLFELWWKEERFSLSRDEFKHLATSKQSILKFEITKYLVNLTNEIKPELLEEANLLKKSNIDGIITTNWDSLLEKIFPDFTVYVGQDELVFSEQISIGQIYKIHGSVSDPRSLIATQEDYLDFNARYPYLAAKLLTIFVEQPIIFIGYSLDDHNIHDVLKSLILCMTKEKVEKLKDRLIICQWDPDIAEPIFSDSSLLISGTVIPIKVIKLSEFKSLFEVLANNKKRLPVKILRHMKDMIYEFVKTSNPKTQIFVSDDLDKLEDSQDVQFVYGIGLKDRLAEHGVKGINLRDLLKDILISNDWNPSKICRMVLTNQSARYIPYFKYLKTSGFLNGDGNIPEDSPIREFNPEFISKVNAIKQQDFFPSQSYARKIDEINSTYSSLQELIDSQDLLHVCMYTPLLEINKIDLTVLKNYLLDHLVQMANNTNLRKLVCYYDYLANRLS